MFDYLLDPTSNWSWETFFLYYLVSIIVVSLCKAGIGIVGADEGIFQSSMNKRKEKFAPFFLAYLMLVVLATLRTNMVGSDTWKYVDEFINIDRLSFKTFDWSAFFLFHQKEPIYTLFTILVRTLSDNYHVYFFCLYSMVAGSYILFLKHFLRKGINGSFLKLFIVFYVANMSGMRSALATVPLLLSFIALDKKQYKWSILYTILAVLCHYTMLYNFFIIIGVWIVRRFVFFQKKKWVILAFSLVLFISLFSASSLLGVFADTKYSFYTENASDMTFAGSAIYVILGLFLLVNFKQLNKDLKYQTLFYILLFFLISYPFLYVTAAYRIPNYYALPRLVIWCVLIDMIISKNPQMKREVALCAEFMVFAYMLLKFYKSSLDGYFMYIV